MMLIFLHFFSSLNVLTPAKVLVEPSTTAIKVQHASAIITFDELNDVGIPVFGMPAIHLYYFVMHGVFKKKKGCVPQPM